MTTATKGKILQNDIEYWNGVDNSASRKDSTGGTISGQPVGREVDVLAVYGRGTSYTRQTIVDCVNRIGSTNRTLVFAPGTWTIDDDLTIGSNFTCRIPNGVVFNVSSGKALTFTGPTMRDGNTWTSGSGTVTEAGTRYISGKLDLTGAVLQGTNAIVFEGSSADDYETTFVITNPTADRTITFPDASVDLGAIVSGSASNTFSAMQFFTAGIGPSFIQNLGLAASVSAKALTVALNTKALATPSSADPVQIAFRNATATTGDYTIVGATAATSVVVPSGGTLGFIAAEAGLVYVYAINNAGTLELAVAKKAVFDEATTHDTTAIGTGSDSDNVLYSTSARTGVAIRLIGRISITTGAVAGEWDNAPTRVSVGNINSLFDKFSHPALTSGTATATTSGTSHDYTIPSWATLIAIDIIALSTNGTSVPIIQLGDSGGIEPTGYNGGVSQMSSGVSSANHNTGFYLAPSWSATVVPHGTLYLSLADAATNTWAISGVLGRTDGAATLCVGGTKALSAALTTVRLTTVNGTDATDAGSFNVKYL